MVNVFYGCWGIFYYGVRGGYCFLWYKVFIFRGGIITYKLERLLFFIDIFLFVDIV